MNWRRLKNAGDPPSGTRVEQARWILAQSSDHSFGDGQRVVDLLLSCRDSSDLSSEELDLLAPGYNWWGKHAEAFGVAKLNLARAPHSHERFRLAGLYAHNAFCHDLPGFAAACDGQIAAGLEPHSGS
jgi:hypothetical protein